MRWSLALAALPFLLVAGCTSPDFTVPVDADATADIVAAEGEAPPEPYILRVAVRHEHAGGDPVAGVGVVVFDTTEPAHVEYARTDAAGNAELRFFVAGFASVAAGGAEGLTTEGARGLLLGAPGESGALDLVLYDTLRPIDAAGAFDLALPLPGAPATSDVGVAFADDEAIGAAYLQRLVGLEAELRWMNSPTSYGDLYAIARSSDGAVEHPGDDQMDLPRLGANSEWVRLDEDQATSLGEAAAGPGLQLRAASRSPIVAVEPLEFTFVGSAQFRGSDLVIA